PDAQDIDLDGSYANMAKRARMLLDAGVDQFGGLNTTAPIIKAYENASTADQAILLDQMRDSAYRLLKNIFRTGLFENPYLDAAQTKATAGNDEFRKAGYDAQLKSMVLVKNEDNLLPLRSGLKVYVPGNAEEPLAEETLDLLKTRFSAENVITDAASAAGADVALVFMNSITSGGGSRDMVTHTNSYTPVNLDFKDYTASAARATSVAGEPIRDGSGAVTGIFNRSYKDKTTVAYDGIGGGFFGGGAPDIAGSAAGQLERLAAAKASGKPVVVVFDVSNPSVLTEIEPSADAILVTFQPQRSAVLDMLAGSTSYTGAAQAIRPTGMLPMQFPKDMNEVEQQYEDVPRDMIPYRDSAGNDYDFGFGLSWTTDALHASVRVDASVNLAYAEFVLQNQIPMTAPINKGSSSSNYSIEKRIQVTFDYGYKEDAADKANKRLIKVVNSGAAVSAEAPARPGCTFTGWTLGGVAYNFSAPVTEDITLVASWLEKPASPTLTFSAGGGGGFGGPAGPSVTLNHPGIPQMGATQADCDRVAFFYTTDGSDPTTSPTATEVHATIMTWGTFGFVISPTVSTPSPVIVKAAVKIDGEFSEVASIAAVALSLAASEDSGVRDAGAYPLAARFTLSNTAYNGSVTGAWYAVESRTARDGALLDSSQTISAAGATPYTIGETVAVPRPAAGQATVVQVLARATVLGEAVELKALYYYTAIDGLVKLTATNAPQVVEKMLLSDKISLLSGVGTAAGGLANTGVAGATLPLPAYGIPSIALSDGPTGVRMGSNATVWTNPTGISATWNVETAAAIAQRVGAEAKAYGVDYMLGPALNIQRNPLGGRDFEYYSEDPVLSGTTAGYYTAALQSEGVGATLKHYALNNQEDERMGGVGLASERALREIYLRGFEIATDIGKPWSVMSSYNRPNGKYASANTWLLTDVLRGDWGFDGFVMTDWGGAHDVPQDNWVEAQNDLAMPSGNLTQVTSWVYDGTTALTFAQKVALIDRNVTNILNAIVKSNTFKGLYASMTPADVASLSGNFKNTALYEESRAVNRATAAEAMVLLKNEGGTLPLPAGKSVAIVNVSELGGGGMFGGLSNTSYNDFVVEGGGSAAVTFDPSYTVDIKTGFENAGYTVRSETIRANAAITAAEAAQYAGAADYGVFLISRPSSEGADNTRESFDLSAAETASYEALAGAFHGAGKKVIVLINAGAAINVSAFKESADAILDIWLPGTEGGNAALDVLTGKVNPSGKLTQTFPLTYNDSPSIAMAKAGHEGQTWSSNPEYYDEGVYVGYRYFDTFGKSDRVAYPFGHGLSYTAYAYSNLRVSSSYFAPGDDSATVTVSVDVANTGSAAGSEVVQLYLGANTYKAEGRPVKELKHYAKVALNPGETKTVRFTVTKRDLQYYDDANLDNALVYTPGAAPGDPGASSVVYGRGDGWTVALNTQFTVTAGGTSDPAALAARGVSGVFTYGTQPSTPPSSGGSGGGTYSGGGSGSSGTPAQSQTTGTGTGSSAAPADAVSKGLVTIAMEEGAEPRLGANNTLTIPAGATAEITTPGGPVVSAPGGTTIASDGTVT
ncbi:MAG: glycoside hydrolase family 3 C-terminal domain-containing protein, partial [Clostridiales bacterium]|nr:glycoside hydrolase family 3 C-terminal domain-containing protein [Clostridiales bacterium]